MFFSLDTSQRSDQTLQIYTDVHDEQNAGDLWGLWNIVCVERG